MKRLLIPFCTALSLLLAGCPARHDQTAGSASPPGRTVQAAQDPKAIFQQKCSGCHGANGGGGIGPNLTKVADKGDAFIKHRIIHGSPTKGMPAFGAELSDREIDALVQYVKSL